MVTLRNRLTDLAQADYGILGYRGLNIFLATSLQPVSVRTYLTSPDPVPIQYFFAIYNAPSVVL